MSRVASITITAPSTRMPKSSAPRLIRLPLIPKRFMPITANRNDSGITSAVIAAARMLPSSRNSTTMTSSAPSVRFLATVLTVELTSTLRSSTGSATMPGGSERLTSVRRSAAASATVRLLPPAIINAVPSTASWPSRVAAPSRGACPMPTLATSATRITRPSRLATGACARSSTVCASASARTIRPSPARWTMPAPAWTLARSRACTSSPRPIP